MISTLEIELVLVLNTELDSQDSRFTIPLYRVGDGVALMRYTDVDPGTIIKVSPNGREIHVQMDKAVSDPNFKPEIISGGFAGHCTNQHEQKWNFEQDQSGRIEVHTLRTWRGIKIWAQKGGAPNGRNSISPGRSKFYDRNF